MWSSQQRIALDRVRAWLESKDKPVFYVGGYAGTGKTTLAKELASEARGRTYFAAFTGKAARVMRSKGCDEATTLHRLVYRPKGKSRLKLNELLAELKRAPNEDEAKALQELISEEKDRVNSPHFELNEKSPLLEAGLLVIDECSMVGKNLAQDLLSFGVPVLVLGDPAQLPPVKGAGYFTNREPDALLTEIHRQAEGSPVLQLATRVRQEGAKAVDADKLVADDLLRYDQVLVGKNDTRRRVNVKARELLGLKGRYPVEGDRVVCLKNDHKIGLLNGATFRVTADAVELDERDLVLCLVDEDTGEAIEVKVSRATFDQYVEPEAEDPREYWQKKGVGEFDFAYALTVHKAQGSQWNSVLVVDDGFAWRRPAERGRWMYTAITRASERVRVTRLK